MTRLLNKSVYLSLAIVCVAIINVLVVFLIREKTSTFKKQPLISVIITSYNYEKYIPKTLDSVLEQTYKNYEVIIVDDGSKDNSIEIIKRYTNKYKNFYLYTHENNQNKGLVESIKLAISKAKGDYIAFLESDDYWHKNNLLEKIKIINKYDDALFISNSVELFGDSELIKMRAMYINRIEQVLVRKNVIHPLQLRELNPIPTFSCIMIKKEILDKLDYNPPIAQLLDYWLYRQILLFNPLYHVKRNLTYWHQHGSSYYTSTKDGIELDAFIKACNDMLFSGKIKLKKYTPF